jgi:hypothetical protein
MFPAGLSRGAANKSYPQFGRFLNSLHGPKQVAMRGYVGGGLSNVTDTTQTSRLRFPLLGGVTCIRLVYQNFYLQSGATEPTNTSTVTVQASIENPNASIGSPTGTSLIPVFFNGQTTGTMSPSGILISDPIYVNVGNGQPIWVRSCPSVSAGGTWVDNYVTNNSGSIGFDGGGPNEGVITGSNYTTSGTIANSNSNAFGPCAIIAVAQNPVPSVMLFGDSICYGTGIVNLGQTSYAARACINAGLPFIRLAEGGETYATVSNQGNYWHRGRFTEFCSHALCEYGTNDLATASLSALQSYAQTCWAMLAQAGLQVYQTTLLPKVSGTDGCATPANQTPLSYEAVRTGFNDWLRSGAAGLANSSLSGFLDPCAAIEVNAAGVLTTDGGRWASAGGVILSGTATSVSTTSLTDTTQSRTVNGDALMVIAITGGTTGTGQSSEVSTNTATAWSFLSALAVAPTGTVTYSLVKSYCSDYTHPTEGGHMLIGNSLNLSGWHL